MNIEETKLGLMQKIMSVSKPSLLEKIDKLLEEEMIVGYTINGEPLTKELYNLRLQKGEQQLKSGQYTTQDNLEKESESW